VQVLIGHGIAHAEASSNVYLEGESRLSLDQEHLLAELGWQRPQRDDDDPEEMPANWFLPRIHRDWQYLTEMLVATWWVCSVSPRSCPCSCVPSPRRTPAPTVRGATSSDVFLGRHRDVEAERHP
jgi:hypothetical protein